MEEGRPVRTFRGKLKFNINKLVKWALMALPVLISIIIIWLAIRKNIEPYKLWGGITGSFTFLHVFHTIVYFLEPKYYTKRRKKYIPFWLALGIVAIIGCFVILSYGNIAIVGVGPLLIVSIVWGLIKIEYT
ncbi:MAG: hypothetical protein GF364_02755, partial [Candidatus Lokiarchaeota archaeon]|nr:hypothetical protein [Candidatus Lokiarchaeota archaeon]